MHTTMSYEQDVVEQLLGLFVATTIYHIHILVAASCKNLMHP